MIEASDLPPRARRLESLANNLSREVALTIRADTVLQRQERQAYLTAIQHAIGALEDARVALVRAAQRASRAA